ncbi:MAG: hypothetical protein H6658_20650 [Ardenticatenaceae bacterium]|nr:hypothetical protein [Ardenticatenaceae bacterium]
MMISVSRDQIATHCRDYGSKKYYGLIGTDLLVRRSDLHIVSQNSDILTAKELEIAQNALKTAVERSGDTNGRSDKAWAETAVKQELEAIGRLHGDNPHRPDSEFWACLLRIASVVKGSGRQHIAPARVRTAVLQYAPDTLKTKGNRQKDIEYLFGRAMNQARPRYRIKAAK